MTIKKKFLLHFIILSLIFICPSYSQYFNIFEGNNIDNNKNNLKPSDYDDIFGDIYILRPSNSDVLKIGQSFSIKWSYKGSIELVTIALYKGYKSIDTIAITTTNDGEYLWFIDNYTDSDDYSIGIWDFNDFNNNDFSDFFTITSQSQNNSENKLLLIIIGILIVIAVLSISYIILKFRKNR